MMWSIFCVTMSVYNDNKIHISDTFDIAIYKQGYEYEYMHAKSEKHVLQTKEQVLHNIAETYERMKIK